MLAGIIIGAIVAAISLSFRLNISAPNGGWERFRLLCRLSMCERFICDNGDSIIWKGRSCHPCDGPIEGPVSQKIIYFWPEYRRISSSNALIS